jgi:prepilin-type N-terminal cleavage/methylation domain-containing protein
MKGGSRPPGYTIIEVMIVLAISGVMFLIAATFISGKQERTSFFAGVNDMASNIQDVIEQVTDGQYSDIPLGCTANGGIPTISNSGTNAQGTNEGCVFLGKVLRFSNGSSQYKTISLAGAQLDANTLIGTTQENLNSSYPIVIEPSGASLTTTQTISQNLKVDCVLFDNPTAKCPNMSTQGNDFGFVQSVGAGNTSSPGNFQSGAQTILLVSDTTLNDSAPDSSLSSTSPANSNLTIGSSASICVTDGSRYATIDVGATNGDQFSANVTMDGTTTC